MTEMTPAEWEKKAIENRENELVRRYNENLPLSKADKKEARKLIKNRG